MGRSNRRAKEVAPEPAGEDIQILPWITLL